MSCNQINSCNLNENRNNCVNIRFVEQDNHISKVPLRKNCNSVCIESQSPRINVTHRPQLLVQVYLKAIKRIGQNFLDTYCRTFGFRDFYYTVSRDFISTEN